MSHDHGNVYDDPARAAAYATLDFPGTYHLAFRDLPRIIAAHVAGRAALDFGCGTGRSTRFLKGLGFAPLLGLDIAASMIEQARRRDPMGDYRLIRDGDLATWPPCSQDLILAAFTFDNVPTRERKIELFRSLGRLLTANGRLVNLGSTPDIYCNEWASFSTVDFPENAKAKNGDPVRIVMLDVADRRPVEDILWTAEDFLEVVQEAGLEVVDTQRPLGLPTDPVAWVSETRIAPWVITVLRWRDQEAAEHPA